MRSIIIGEGTMPVACARVLVRRGHQIVATSSPDAPLRDWSSAADVPHVRGIADLLALVEETEFDCLFSIVNYRVLPPALLHKPRRLAINYHDAPLPRYAGTYATSWALMDGETEHGVTWHQMMDEVDAGDVLSQVAVPIAPLETAGSLNHKCFFSGVHSLGVLAGELAAGTLQPRPQDTSRRSYYPFLLRPPGACAIDFHRSAEEVARFVRALSFGRSPNPFGTPKIPAGEDWLIVGTATALTAEGQESPGTVLSTDDTGLVIAAAHGCVRLEGVTSIAGDPMDVRDFDWSAGVPSTGGSRRELATAAYEAAIRDERRWVAWLGSLTPAQMRGTGSSGRTVDTLHRPALRRANDAPRARLSATGDRVGSAAAHARFLLSTGLSPELVVGVVTEGRIAPTRAVGDLVCPVVPVRLDALARWEEGWMSSTLATEARDLAPYATDLALRYPGHVPGAVVHLPIVLAARDRSDISDLPRNARGAELTIVLPRDQGGCHWYAADEHAGTEVMFRAYLAWSDDQAAV